MNHPDVPAPRDETRMPVALTLGSPSVIRVAGEADLDTIGPLRHAVEQALTHHPHLVLDLAGVTFADSTFLNTLLRARATALEQGGSVRLSATSSCVDHLLAITGTTQVLPTLAGAARRAEGPERR